MLSSCFSRGESCEQSSPAGVLVCQSLSLGAHPSVCMARCGAGMGLPLPHSSCSTGGEHKSCVWPWFGQVSVPLSHLMKLIHAQGAAHPLDCFHLCELLILSQLLPPPPGTPSCFFPIFSLSDSSKPISVFSMLPAPHSASVAAGLSLH